MRTERPLRIPEYASSAVAVDAMGSVRPKAGSAATEVSATKAAAGAVMETRLAK
jgi:hypothetical protein